MKFNLENVDKKALAIGVLLGVFFLAGILYMIFSNGDDEDLLPVTPIEQPISFEEDKQIIINTGDNGTNFEEPPQVPKVYSLVKVNHQDKVQSFIADIGKGFVRVNNIEDILYTWQEDASKPLYLVEYNSVLDKVFFRFEDSVDPKKVGMDDLEQSELEQYFKTFAKTYWGEQAEYTNIKISPSNRAFKVEGQRMIDGVAVESSTNGGVNDYLIINLDGTVSEGLFYIFEFDSGSGVEIPLISVNLLGSVISRDDYPKTFIQGNPVGLDFEDLGVEQNIGEYPDYPTHTVYIEDLVPEVNRCTAKNIKVVYLFMNVDSEKISPTYKVDCVGEVTIKSVEYDVPVTIYTSAIDPQYVYVPPQ